MTRTWTAKDASNNTSTASQTISVVDNTPPTIGALPVSSTVPCPATPAFTTPTTSDACSAVTLTSADVTTAGSCANNYSVTRTWSAKDACNNTSTASQTISVVDNTPPTIGALPAPSTVTCPATPAFTTPTTSDACSAVTLTSADVTTAGSCEKNYSVSRNLTAT